MSGDLPLVLTTIGTDHHPFTRLVRWVDGWAAERTGLVRSVIQSGTSDPPEESEWRDYVPHDELQTLLDQASAVVSHGGPGTIIECRRRGIVPIVVPRRPELGEHVDDHQVRFSRVLASSGHVVVPEREDDLRTELSRVMVDRDAFRTPTDGEDANAAVNRFSELVGMLVIGRSDG